jgi:heme-degrading monooxygenase HmoA
MYASVRTWSAEAAEPLAARAREVKELISTVDGFRAYYLVRTDDATITVTVCDDEAGCDESTKRAREFMREHAAEIPGGSVRVSAGEVLVSS